ncbi:MAG: DUF4143 domain-containing protein [Acidimicrobiaceae bacterium]|nr:DUF4143 domain-containing protein [Acidimicrobiaceae bacterium]MDE0322276.1 DUF4143 domain-containing protein [Acidimicrobiaceae bacterium]MDE0498178.1 DUF4143 domain-containing protein [Acidimicrobiaceae bacterium]
MEYIPRIGDDILAARLRSAPMVVVEGPRACGKTELARRQAASVVRFDVDGAARAAAELNPSAILDLPRPILLDEWQFAPSVWNQARRRSDDAGGVGHFILTGSAVPPDDRTRHSGVGRVSRFRLRPMSLFELGHSTGEVSLEALFARASGHGTGRPELVLSDVIEMVCRGGWPATAAADAASAVDYVRDQIEEICRTDIAGLEGPRHDPVRMRQLLVSLARNVATEATLETLSADVAEAGERITTETVAAYLRSLQRLFVVEEQRHWSVSLRSRSRLRKSPKRHFADPSLAAAALGAGEARLGRDMELLGLLFESLVVRDLRIYAEPLRASVFHYRDNTGLEADAVIERSDGSWIAAEVKLGGQRAVDSAARSLLRLRERVDTERAGEPAALVIVTATGYPLARPDGVSVIPVTALGP